MPQLNVHDFPPQLVWLLISFVLLYFAMAKVALPKIGDVLEARAEKIRGDLDQASALKSESDAALAAYDKALAEARGKAQELARASDAAVAKEAAERQARLGAELGGRIKDAEGRIASAKATAMGNLAAVAAETARLAAQRVAGLAVAPADAEAAARAALAERGRS